MKALTCCTLILVFLSACNQGGSAAPATAANPSNPVPVVIPAVPNVNGYIEITPDNCTEVIPQQRWARVVAADTIRYFEGDGECLIGTASMTSEDVSPGHSYQDPWFNVEVFASASAAGLSDPDNIWLYFQ